MQWPRELAGVLTKVSFSAVNNSNKPQTGIKVSLSDQHDSARAKHKATNSLPMKILFLPFAGKSTNYNTPIFVFIRLQHAPFNVLSNVFGCTVMYNVFKYNVMYNV